MQYILSEEEYNDLNETIENERSKIKNDLQRLCTEVAIYKPVMFLGSEYPEPWGCIIDGSTECCDECPVQDMCPCEFQQWSQ